MSINPDEMYEDLHTVADALGTLKTNVLSTWREYEDKKLILIGELECIGNKWRFTGFHCLLKLKTDTGSQAQPRFGLEAKKLDLTDVLIAHLVASETLSISYFRPGKWTTYIKQLADIVTTRSNQAMQLNHRPIEDEGLFSDL